MIVGYYKTSFLIILVVFDDLIRNLMGFEIGKKFEPQSCVFEIEIEIKF